MSTPNVPERGRQTLVETTGIDTDDVSDIEAELSVKNIGGIEESTVTFHPGITILTGENATNRTSLLTALNGVLGGTKATVRGDADDGHVALRFNPAGDTDAMFNRTYYHDASTERGSARVEGEPFCDDADLVDTFATLLEDNDARRTVERGDDIRDVLMRPVDTAAIERAIRENRRERQDLQDRLDEIDRAAGREPELTEKRERLTDDLEDIEAEIEEMNAVVDEYEADEDMAADAEQLVEDLEAKRDEKRDIENRLEVLNAELDGLEEEEREIRSEVSVQDPSSDPTELGDHGGPMVETTDFKVEWQDDLDETIQDLQHQEQSLQTRKDELNSTIDDLTRIIQLNENATENLSDISGIADNTDNDSVTAQLDPSSEQVECWTCGSTVEKNAITERTRELQEFVKEKRSEVSNVEDELEDVRDRLTTLRETRRERKQLRDRLEELQREKEDVRESIAAAESNLEDIKDDISGLETEAEETAELRESDLLDAYQELTEKQYDRGRLKQRIEDVDNELEEIRELKNERETVASDLEAVRGTISELRTRVADLERDAVEAFNDHMESILDRLQYENIARVWIERKVSNSSDTTAAGEFDLHIVRESDGAAYSHTVDTLSESEREVIGLIVALAGYLVHDVAEKVPFIILDSVEAVDANRLVELVDHFSKHTMFLTVALLPEDAAEFPGNIHRITADELTQTSAT